MIKHKVEADEKLGYQRKLVSRVAQTQRRLDALSATQTNYTKSP